MMHSTNSQRKKRPSPLELSGLMGDLNDSGVPRSPKKSPKISAALSGCVASPPKAHFPMCTICRDSLFSYDDDTSFPTLVQRGRSHSFNLSMRPVVSTKCGHLFHTQCINKWFQTKRGQEMKPCPYCQREMMANDTKRIFPVVGEGEE